MDHSPRNPNVYQAGGSLSRDFPTYVERPADEKIYQHILNGEFCFVLAARQMGKSSMKVRTIGRLQMDSKFICASVDLTSLGSQSTNPDQWYYSFLLRISRSLRIVPQFKDWWNERSGLTQIMRLADFFEELVLKNITENIVIFIDEIDSLLSLDRKKFNTDDFFAVIRQTFNARAENSDFYRLRFVILGVATPQDLMQDISRTPFNIGVPIPLDNFNYESASPLLKGLQHIQTKSDKLLEEILKWTGGQPYLSQRLCKEIALNETEIQADKIENIVGKYVQKLFLASLTIETDHNLSNVSKRIINDEKYNVQMLGLYEKILSSYSVEANSADITQIYLKLTGLVIESNGALIVANNIYLEKFNRNWLIQTLEKINRPYSQQLNLWMKAGKSAKVLKLKKSEVSEIHSWSSKQHDISLLEKEFIDDIILYDRERETRHKKYLSRTLLFVVFITILTLLLAYSTLKNAREILKRDHIIREREIDLDLKEAEIVELTKLIESREQKLIKFDYKINIAKEIVDSLDNHAASQGERVVLLGKSMEYTDKASTYSSINPTLGFSFALQALIYHNNQAAKNVLYRIYSKNTFYDSLYTVPKTGIFSCSQNGTSFIAKDVDNKVYLWNINGEKINEIPLTQSFNSSAFSTDGSKVFLFKRDSAEIWSSDGVKLSSMRLNKKIKFLPNNIANDGTFATHENNTLNFHDIHGQVKAVKTEHKTEIRHVIFSPSEKYIASASKDGMVILRDANGVYLSEHQSHEADITALFFSPDEELICSGSKDKTVTAVRVSDLLNKVNVPRTVVLKGHNGNISTIAMSSDNRFYFTGSEDETTKMWDATGNLIKTFRGQEAKTIAIIPHKNEHSIKTISINGKVFEWHYRGFIEEQIDGNASSLSPKGLIAYSNAKNEIIIENKEGKYKKIHNIGEKCTSTAFSPKENIIALGTKSGNVIFLNYETGEIHTKPRQSPFERITSINFSPDGKLLGSVSKTSVKVWNTKGQKQFEISVGTNNAQYICFSHDNNYIGVTSSDRTAKIYNINGKLIRTLKGHDHAVTMMAFDKENNFIYTVSRDKVLKKWTFDGRCVKSFTWDSQDILQIFISPDGNYFITSSYVDNDAKLWDNNKNLLQEFKGMDILINYVAFSSTSNHLILGNISELKSYLWNTKVSLEEFTKSNK